MNQISQRTVKLNWGRALTIGMVLFMSFIITLVVILISKKVDLVSEDYYQREIAYGDEITAKENWNKLAVDLKFERLSDHVVLHLPDIQGVDEFQLSFSRPNDKREDQQFLIQQSNTFLIKRSELKTGVYLYKLSATAQGKTYLCTGKYMVK